MEALRAENEELKMKLNEMKNKIQSREVILRDGKESLLCLSSDLSISRNCKESNFVLDQNEDPKCDQETV
jgi:hypothetical protein